MSSTAKKNTLADVDVESIIQDSVRKEKSLMREPQRDVANDQISESYVAEPKTYSQVSEFVSQKTKEAHIALYQGYVETLNRVSAELDTAPRGAADSKHSEMKSLKGDESHNLNAVWLHELYFANCFDCHSEIYMDSAAYIELERAWGTFQDWQKDMIACAMCVGDGWVVCGYNMFLKRYVNTVIKGNHHDVMLGLYPILVIDMHEHAFFKDYLTDKRSYIIAMMREINWNVVEERVKKTKSIAEALK